VKKTINIPEGSIAVKKKLKKPFPFFLALVLLPVLILLLLSMVDKWHSALQDHQAFHKIFGEDAPWCMSQEQRKALQPLVTQELTDLSEMLAIAKNMPPSQGARNDYARERILDIKMSERDLRNANSAARAFSFNLDILMCGDEHYPFDGKCIDGSNPTLRRQVPSQ